MDDPPAGDGAFRGLLFGFEGGLAVLALALGLLMQRPPLDQIDWTAAGIGQGVLATVPMVLLLLAIVRWPVGPFRRLLDLVEKQLVPWLGGLSLADLALVSVLAGVGEEMLFRGVLQTSLSNWSNSLWLGVVAAAAVFGAVHAISTTYAVLAGAIGVYLGWLQVQTDNLLVPIVAHALYDFVALVMLVRMRGAPLRIDPVSREPDASQGTAVAGEQSAVHEARDD